MANIKMRSIWVFDELNVFCKKTKMDKIILFILSIVMLCWTKMSNDSWAYVHGASSILEGQYYFENTTISMRPIFPPMYPLYLAIFVKILGNNLIAIQISNLVLFLISCVIFFRIEKNTLIRLGFLFYFSLLFGNILSETLFFVLILIIYYINRVLASSFVKYPLMILLYTMLIFTRSIGILVVPFLLLIFSNVSISNFRYGEFKNFISKNVPNFLLFLAILFLYKSVDFMFFGSYRDTHVFQIGIGKYTTLEYLFQFLNFLGASLNPLRFYFQNHYLNILIIGILMIPIAVKNIRIIILLIFILISYVVIFSNIFITDNIDYRFLFWLFLMVFLIENFPYRKPITLLLMISSIGFFVQHNEQSLEGCFHYNADERDISANFHSKFLDTQKDTSLLGMSIYGPFVLFDTINGTRLIGAGRLHEVYYDVPCLED